MNAQTYKMPETVKTTFSYIINLCDTTRHGSGGLTGFLYTHIRLSIKLRY